MRERSLKGGDRENNMVMKKYKISCIMLSHTHICAHTSYDRKSRTEYFEKEKRQKKAETKDGMKPIICRLIKINRKNSYLYIIKRLINPQNSLLFSFFICLFFLILLANGGMSR